jgi:hypothetical protein
MKRNRQKIVTRENSRVRQYRRFGTIQRRDNRVFTIPASRMILSLIGFGGTLNLIKSKWFVTPDQS